jgi:hypothetical protein
MNVEQIAKVCHEANRAYCATIGDLSQTEWEAAPEWQRQSAIHGVEFHMQRHETQDASMTNLVPDPAASHRNWLKEKLADGWKYGPVKDPEKKEHPCCVPFEKLPLEQKMKDYIFSHIVLAFYVGNLEAKAVSA